MLWKFGRPLFDADKGAAGGGSGDGDAPPPNGTGGSTETPLELKYETWVAKQPDDVKTMLSGWERGLKTALESERDARKKLEKDLRELAGKAEKDSEAQKKLTEMADQMGEADRKADFYEAAHAAGVSNLKLAYLVATQDELFDRRGLVNFEAMKQSYPELFGGAKKAPAGNAGAGTNNNQPPAASMNEYIRKAAGRA